MGGNDEACDTGKADNKDVVHVDVEGTASKAGDKPAVAAVDMEGTEDEGREVWEEEGHSGGAGCLSQALNLGDIVDMDLVTLEAA